MDPLQRNIGSPPPIYYTMTDKGCMAGKKVGRSYWKLLGRVLIARGIPC